MKNTVLVFLQLTMKLLIKNKLKGGMETGKPQIDQLFEDDSSIKEGIKDGTLMSDDILTYSLSNTLKTGD